MRRCMFLVVLCVLVSFVFGLSVGAATPGTQKWKAEVLYGSESVPAIGSDGTVYIGSYGNYLYAINQDGSLEWKFKTMDEIISSPAIDPDGTIYVGSWDSYLYAITPDGALKWKFKTGYEIDSSPAIDSDGTIYVGSGDGYLYAINPDGTLKWKFETGNYILSSPAIGSDGTIYVGSNDGYLYAINSDGILKWKFETGLLEMYSSPAVDSDGTIYIDGNNGYLYAVNPNGTLKWKFYCRVGVSSPAIGSDGTIYVGSNDNHLYAINPDGTLKWKFETGDYIFSSPAIGSDGTIYVGSEDGYLYAINSDGTLKWKFETRFSIDSSPAIGSDGTVYVGSNDGYLYAINSDSRGLAESPWPKFHHDNRNTGNVLSKGGSVPTGSPFSDIDDPKYSYARDSIIRIYEAGITAGCGDGRYCPDEPVSRWQMAVFLARALHLTDAQCTSQPFSDVPVSSWYCPYVKAIKIAGITTGCGNGMYCPDQSVTRAQMAAYLARAMGLPVSQCTSQPFSDVPVDSIYCPYIKAIQVAGITNGCGNGMYCPDQSVTRGQMAVFLDRAFLSGSSQGGGAVDSTKKAASLFGVMLSANTLSLNNTYLSMFFTSSFASSVADINRTPSKSVYDTLLNSTLSDTINSIVRSLVKAKRTIESYSGSIQCPSGGIISYGGNYDTDTSTYSLTLNFSGCVADNMKIDGTATAYGDGVTYVNVNAQNLTISMEYNNQVFRMSTQDLGVNIEIRDEGYTISATLNGALVLEYPSVTATELFDNFNTTASIAEDSYGQWLSTTIVSGGGIRVKNDSYEICFTYNDFTFKLANDSTWSLNGAVEIEDCGGSSCLSSSGNYSFATLEPVKENDSGVSESGIIEINSSDRIQWSSGNVEIYENDSKIFDGSELELVGNMCPLLSAISAQYIGD